MAYYSYFSYPVRAVGCTGELLPRHMKAVLAGYQDTFLESAGVGTHQISGSHLELAGRGLGPLGRVLLEPAWYLNRYVSDGGSSRCPPTRSSSFLHEYQQSEVSRVSWRGVEKKQQRLLSDRSKGKSNAVLCYSEEVQPTDRAEVVPGGGPP